MWDSVEWMETESAVEHDEDLDFLRLKRRKDGARVEARRAEKPETDSSPGKTSERRFFSGSMANETKE
ncbi:hypothetical protein IMZ48_09925 [Candidatus Bathyarchaeota archaeon]|nr:hypothetical protein [Candidatus Bathyarchaeota archaeon]